MEFLGVCSHFSCREQCWFLSVAVAEPPFEFRALEVALEAICSFLDARTTELETAAYPALDELTSKVHNLSELDRIRYILCILINWPYQERPDAVVMG